MNFKLEYSNFNEFLQENHLIDSSKKEEYTNKIISKRNEVLKSFPYSVVLKLSYTQMDLIDWLLWQILYERDGICHESYSEIPACPIQEEHSHTGIWTSLWLAKTDYDYGFNEWFFKNEKECNTLINLLPIVQKFPNNYEEERIESFFSNLAKKLKELQTDEKLRLIKSINW